MLFQPDYETDFHEWDCICGLEVPRTVTIDGKDAIESYRNPALREAVVRLLPDVTFKAPDLGPQKGPSSPERIDAQVKAVKREMDEYNT